MWSYHWSVFFLLFCLYSELNKPEFWTKYAVEWNQFKENHLSPLDLQQPNRKQRNFLNLTSLGSTFVAEISTVFCSCLCCKLFQFNFLCSNLVSKKYFTTMFVWMNFSVGCMIFTWLHCYTWYNIVFVTILLFLSDS
jgi:hypothetical protein